MTTTRPPTAADRSWRLSGAARKATLLVHILSAIGWLGIDLVLGVFVLMTRISGDADVVAVSYQAMRIFAVTMMLPAGLLCLGSGVLLGLGTRYGVVRNWWVAVKLGLNIVLTLLIPLALLPLVENAAEYGRQLASGEMTRAAPSDLLFPPIVSAVTLIFASVLSVYKPWGRIRRASA